MSSAVSIVSVNSDQTYTFNEDALARILLKKEIDDHKVVILSIFGAYRQGKSFMLNFFLRYLHNTYKTPKEDWLGDVNVPLEGFKWRGGIGKETSGIMMWPEPFLATHPNGDKIAIFVMDTQGAFDGESTNKVQTAIFAISTMISSIQIYNLSQNIKDDDLQNLQLFLEYAKIGVEAGDDAKFQKLMYLVRDWSSPHEAAFGFDGGEILLKKKLEVKLEQHEELQSIRRDLKASFKTINCFLMVHPGFEATEKPNFEGKLNELRSEFRSCLRKMIPALLSPERLECKEINGVALNVSHVPTFFKNNVELLNANSLPEAITVFEAQMRLQNLSAQILCKNIYKTAIQEAQSQATAINDLDERHGVLKKQALEKFDVQPKIGSKEVSRTYKTNLEESIEPYYLPIRVRVEVDLSRAQKNHQHHKPPLQRLNNNIRKTFRW